MLFGILDVEPENIDRDVLFVKSLLHAPNVVAADIVPSALVVSKRPMWRKLNRPGQSRILAENMVWRGSGEKENIKNTRLGDPMSLGRLIRGMSDVDPGFRSSGDEDGDSGICGVRMDQRD